MAGAGLSEVKVRLSDERRGTKKDTDHKESFYYSSIR